MTYNLETEARQQQAFWTDCCYNTSRNTKPTPPPEGSPLHPPRRGSEKEMEGWACGRLGRGHHVARKLLWQMPSSVHRPEIFGPQKQLVRGSVYWLLLTRA